MDTYVQNRGHNTWQSNVMRSATKTRKSAETRKRIMRCASELMDERGSTSFRMSEISSRCGMSKGALYYYFTDKDDLLRAIYDQEVDDLVDSIDAAVAQAKSSEEALHGVCRAYSGCVSKGGPLAMAIVRELVMSKDCPDGVDRTTDRDGKRALQHIVGVVMEQLDRAKAEGAIRLEVDTKLIAVAICGAYAFVAMSAAEGDSKAKESSYTEVLYQLVVHGIGASYL